MRGNGIKVEGLEELKLDLSRFTDKMSDDVAEVVQETAAGIEAGVKLRMQQGPHTGRTYKRRTVAHRASAPGEAPAPDTGALMDSIYHQRTGKYSGVAGSRMAYSAHLEFGTFKMAPRPAWRPELKDASKDFNTALDAVLRKHTL